MSDRARVILVLLAVTVVCGGGAFYFFKIYRPAQDLKNAQGEIAGWETRYQAARECLLGKTPGSSRTSEALAIREMAPDPWERGKCTPLISKLNRGEGEDTGVPAVEAAWNDLEKVAQKAALAFARHVSESTTLQHDPLPAALDELDSARQKLRSAAKLSASAANGQALPRAQTVPIGDEKTLTSLTVDAIPSAHGLVLFGSAGGSQSQVVLTAGAAPKVMPVAQGAFRGVPDMTWGAVATPTNIVAGTFDTAGGLDMFSQPMPQPTIAAVGGSLADGVLVFGNATDLVIARAKDRQITAAPPLKIERAETAVDVDGRTAVIWATKDRTQAQIFQPGAPEQAIIEVPSLDTPCMTKDRVWGTNNGTVVSFGGGRPVFQKNLEDLYREPGRVEIHGTETAGMTGEEIEHYHSRSLALQGCTPDAAIFRDHGDTHSVVVCSDDCRKAQIPEAAPEYATLAYAKGKVVGIASHGGVLGVWREGEKPMFYSLPEDAHPVLAHEWYALGLTDNNVIDLIARGEKTFVLIRIPAGS